MRQNGSSECTFAPWRRVWASSALLCSLLQTGAALNATIGLYTTQSPLFQAPAAVSASSNIAVRMSGLKVLLWASAQDSNAWRPCWIENAIASSYLHPRNMLLIANEMMMSAWSFARSTTDSSRSARRALSFVDASTRAPARLGFHRVCAILPAAKYTCASIHPTLQHLRYCFPHQVSRAPIY